MPASLLGVRHQLELHRPTCFRLDDDRTSSDMATEDDIADRHLHYITTRQPAVDRQVEQRSIPQSLVLVEKKRMAQTCRGLSARLAPPLRPPFQGRRSPAIGSNCDVPMAFSPWPSWPRRERGRGGTAFPGGHLLSIARCIQFELWHSKRSRSATAHLQTFKAHVKFASMEGACDRIDQFSSN